MVATDITMFMMVYTGFSLLFSNYMILVASFLIILPIYVFATLRISLSFKIMDKFLKFVKDPSYAASTNAKSELNDGGNSSISYFKSYSYGDCINSHPPESSNNFDVHVTSPNAF